jgi:hypothetical protein
MKLTASVMFDSFYNSTLSAAADIPKTKKQKVKSKAKENAAIKSKPEPPRTRVALGEIRVPRWQLSYKPVKTKPSDIS